MLELLSVLVLTAHLLAMNLATATPLIVAGLHWWGATRGRDPLAVPLARLSAQAIVVGVLLGVVQLALAWHDHALLLQQAFELLPVRRYWFGATELIFSWACLVGYARAVATRQAADKTVSAWWALLPFAAATNLAYHFPPLFAMLGVYGTRPESWGKPLSFVAALGDPEIGGLWLHFLLASATVAGLALAWCALRTKQPDHNAQRGTLAGGRIALGATVLQLVSGLHLLSVVDERARDSLLGGDLFGTLGFAAALVATVMLLHRLASIALAETTLAELRGTALTLMLVVLCMVGSLQASRRLIHNQILNEEKRETTSELSL
ncbi:MAG: hypothetical protein JNM18_00610 [Planctomycetaceae bacterium]|nr:hypothetical protein [Planctomycetaceae bacterium]